MIWANETNPSYGRTGGNPPAWLPREHWARWHRLRLARMLFEGRHRQFFMEEGRTAYDFRELSAGRATFYRSYNLLGLITKKISDLLFGEQARVYSEEPAVQDVIGAIADRSWLPAVLIEAAQDASWAGDAFLEITFAQPRGAHIRKFTTDEIYPLGVAGPDHQFARYVRYATHDAGAAGTLLLETVYVAGGIERRLYQVARETSDWREAGTGAGQAAQLVKREVALSAWPEPLAPLEATGLSRPSVVRVPNELGARSDYDGLIEPQDDLNAKHTQVARVLVKHSDPKLAVPVRLFDPSGNVPAGAEVFAKDEGGEVPEYIVWDAKLEPAMEDRRFALSALATAAEMPLSLLGVKDDAAVESARKMRLAAANALAKAQRKAVVWREAIRLAVGLAIEADRGFAAAEPIGVEMRDGLPDDELDRATVISTLRMSEVMSKRRALRMQWLDEASVDDELGELEAEAKAKTPDIFLGEPREAGAPVAAGAGGRDVTEPSQTEAA